jgi:hypothetical protein
MIKIILDFKWGYTKKINLDKSVIDIIQLFQILLQQWKVMNFILMDVGWLSKIFIDPDEVDVIELNNVITLQSCGIVKRMLDDYQGAS